MRLRKLFDINVEFVHETTKAVKYTDGDYEFWVPKSIIGPDGYIQVEANADGTFTLTAPEDWLNERGLI
jgi:hypothetical protein